MKVEYNNYGTFSRGFTGFPCRYTAYGQEFVYPQVVNVNFVLTLVDVYLQASLI